MPRLNLTSPKSVRRFFPAAGLQRKAILAAVLLSAGAGGCSFLKSLAGANTIDLAEAEVKSMSVDIRKEQKTICPREPVQMAVFAQVMLKGEKEVKSFETWEGKGRVNKNERLDFPDFAFHSKDGTFDEEGWFSPNRNLLASVSTEFEITTAYKRRPDKFTFKTSYKPDYRCVRDGGASGEGGRPGIEGQAGSDGNSGSYGGDRGAGGEGMDGGAGSAGGFGSDGGTGLASTWLRRWSRPRFMTSSSQFVSREG